MCEGTQEKGVERTGGRGSGRAAAGGSDGATGGVPDALDADRIEELADEITTLAAHLHAATHRLLALIADFDRLRGWEREGHRSCAHWLAFRTGIDLGAAREKVRVARALEGLPETSAAMARGSLSFAKVRALTRVARAGAESELLELAQGSTALELERMVRGWRLLDRRGEAELERVRHESRTFSVFPGEDGMYVVRGRLDPEVGAVLMRAVEAASDALYRGVREGGGAAPTVPYLLPAPLPEPTPEQRRADALGLLAERALAAGFGGRGGAEEGEGGEGGEGGEDDGAGPAVPVSGSRAGRYQVVLHVEAATLSRSGEPGRSELEDGTRVSAETSRRVACDASVVEVRHAPDGSVLDVGRRRRTIPPAIRRALEARDRGCRFPGCGSRFTDAHHVVHWAEGGGTKLGNLILACRVHHRLLHEGGWRVEMNAWPGGRPVFYDARGIPAPERPPKMEVRPMIKGSPATDLEPGRGASAAASPDAELGRGASAASAASAAAAEALIRANRRRGVDPSWDTASCRWKRSDDIPLDVLGKAEEAA